MKIKQILRLLLDEFIYGGHVLALGAVSIAFTVSILLAIPLTLTCLLIIYLGIYSVYLYNHYKELAQDILTNPERVKYLQRYIKYAPLIIFFCLSIIIGIQLYLDKIKPLLFSLLVISLGFLYSLWLKKFTTRIVGFKNFFAPLLWMSLVLFLGIFYSITLNFALFLILLFVYLRIFIGISFSDIKDIESDKKGNLKTFVIFLGKKKTIRLLTILNIIVLIPILLGFLLKLLPSISLMLIFTSFYTFYYLKKSQDPKVDITTLTHRTVYNENFLWSMLILIGKLPTLL